MSFKKSILVVLGLTVGQICMQGVGAAQAQTSKESALAIDQMQNLARALKIALARATVLGGSSNPKDL